MGNDRDQEIADLKQRLAALEGQEPQTSLPPKKKRVGCGAMALAAAALVFALGVIGSLLSGGGGTTNSTAGNTTSPMAEASGSPPVTTGNILNDTLLRKSAAEQASVLGKVVGEGCRGKHAFYDGIGHSSLADGQAFWSISCRNGKSYMVEISPDDKDNKVMECSLIRSIRAGECFTKF
jgi:hypothetical protein